MKSKKKANGVYSSMEKRAIIPIQSEYEALIEEIRQLKLDIAALTAERDDLKLHICREIEADYNEKIGNLEQEALQKTLEIKKLVRVIEYIQAAINRQEQASFEEAEKKTNEEYKQYEDELKQKAENIKKNAEYARQRAKQDEKNRQEAERRNAQQQSDESGSVMAAGVKKDEKTAESKDDSDKDSRAEEHSKEEQSKEEKENKNTEHAAEERNETPEEELKRLYRKIVKKLHPDMNPDATEEEKQLLQEAMSAYESGDLERLREIAEEIDDTDIAERFKDTEEDLIQLRAIRDRLLLQKKDLEYQIREIKGSFPYNMKDFLADEEKIREQQEAVRGYIRTCEQEIEKLNAHIEEMRKKLKK